VPRARCSPLTAPRRGILHLNESDSRAASARGNSSRRAGYRPSSSGGAPCRPSRGATAGAVAKSNPWREPPPEKDPLPANPAAREVVAHATLKDVSTLVAGGSSTAGIASVSTGLRSQNP
jgi:hypothetical protein